MAAGGRSGTPRQTLCWWDAERTMGVQKGHESSEGMWGDLGSLWRECR